MASGNEVASVFVFAIEAPNGRLIIAKAVALDDPATFDRARLQELARQPDELSLSASVLNGAIRHHVIGPAGRAFG